ncbi:MAG TPA: hypothetical protein PKD26_16070, partial [Pyrinomonadaceae bacterium]|nr:hypothetical protein [Pyrinomonadaceae bacterium]
DFTIRASARINVVQIRAQCGAVASLGKDTDLGDIFARDLQPESSGAQRRKGFWSGASIFLAELRRFP